MPGSRPSKDDIAARAEHCCEYCGPAPFSVEHIIPRTKGGTDEPDNLCLACQGCNGHKLAAVSATDPITGATERLFHPRLDRWQDHILWSDDATEIVARTAVGRATVGRLQMNRPSLVRYRRALRSAGVHPHPRFLPSDG
jgi:hypothetical protein